MISRAFASAQPVRPSRNDRRYSIAWIRFLEPYRQGSVDLEAADATLHRLGGADAALAATIGNLRDAEQRFIDEWVEPVLVAQPAVGDTAALTELLREDKVLFDAYREVEAEARALVEEQREDAMDQQSLVVVLGAALSIAVSLVVAVEVAVRRCQPAAADTLLAVRQHAAALGTTVEAIGSAAESARWAEDDDLSVPRLAHRLKGSRAAMGAERPAELCRRLQEAADAASPGVLEALTDLPREARRVDAAVADLLGVPR